MAITYPSFKNTLTKADLGIPDYAGALNKGLNLYQNTLKSKYMPRNLENEAVKAEQYNMERKPYAENAGRAFEADIGSKEGTLKKALFDMMMKKREYEQKQFLNNLVGGGSPAMPSQNMEIPSATGKPGHMTPNGFEGSLSGVPAEDYYANGGEDRAAEQEAVNRIDTGQAPNKPMEMTLTKGAGQAPPPLAQNISQGLAANNEQVLSPGTPEMSRLDDIWDKYPQYRAQLKKDYGLEKTETPKYDSKTGVASIITKYPSGKTTVRTTGGGDNQIPLTNEVKGRMQKIIAFAPQVIKDLEDLKNTPSPARLGVWKADKRNAYDRKVKKLAEAFAVAKGWPNVLGSIEKAEKIVNRGDYESTESYNKALDGLIEDVKASQTNADKTLYPNKKGNSGSNLTEKLKKTSTQTNDPLGLGL